MKLDVPFYINDGNECGQISLRMVLEYFGKKISTEEISQRAFAERTGMAWGIGLAKAAHELGFRTNFYSTNITSEIDMLLKNEFYKKHISANTSNTLYKIISYCKQNKIPLNQKPLSPEELLSTVSQDSIPIVLLNWNLVKEKLGFTGYMVPVVGYDKNYVYVNQPGPAEPMQFYPIRRGVFQAARESDGTDQNVIVVYRK